MTDFTFAFVDTLGIATEPPKGVTFTLEAPFSATAQGGYEAAEITVTGSRQGLRDLRRWLKYNVQIIDPQGAVCWEGYVAEIALRFGGANLTLSLERMFNAVKVLYSYSVPGGGNESGETAWLTDTESINTYGRKEILHSAGGETSKASAEALRANVLNASKVITPAVQAMANGTDGATLYCRGKVDTLDWRYYQDTGGIEANEEGGERGLLGWGFTATNVGFVGQGHNRLLDFGGRLTALQENDKLLVSGAGDGTNNTAMTVTKEVEGETHQYVANTVNFEIADDIRDSANGMDWARSYEGIKVTGSSLNDGYYFTGDNVTTAWIETTSSFGAAPIADEAAGASITIDMAHNVQVDVDLDHETPSASVTVKAYGQQIAQSFKLHDGPWDAGEISIKIAKEGEPTDTVTVELRSDNSGVPGTLLASGTIDPDDIPYTTPSWLVAALDSAVTLANATTYWQVIKRTTGTMDAEDYYLVGFDDKGAYGDGVLKLYDGTNWQNPAVTQDLLFQVYGVRQTTDKIADIVADVNGLVLASSAPVASGVLTRRNRDGKSTGWTEIKAMLDQGNTAGQRLLAYVNHQGTLIVEAEPLAPSLYDLVWQDDGILRYSDGRKLAPGALPVGKWVQFESLLDGDWAQDIAAFLVDGASFDSRTGTWELRSKAAGNPFDLSTEQG